MAQGLGTYTVNLLPPCRQAIFSANTFHNDKFLTQATRAHILFCLATLSFSPSPPQLRYEHYPPNFSDFK